MAPKRQKAPRQQRSAGSTRDLGNNSTADLAKESDVLQPLRSLAVASSLIALAALTSPVSQLSLAPVFGGIPSSINHEEALLATFSIGYATRYFWRPGSQLALQYLPLWAACVPALQFVVFQFSDSLGLVAGPMIAGFLSCHAITIAVGYAVAALIEALGLQARWGAPAAHLSTGAAALGSFVYLERAFAAMLPNYMGLSRHLNPLNLQVLTSLTLGGLLPQRKNIFIATVLAANFVALLSPQGSGPYSTAIGNAGLSTQNWTLIARQWSNTGYISVLENTDLNYRVLRCDHSLLGGEWQLTPQRKQEGWKVTEPIYAVFEMLEAVRLLKTPKPVPDTKAKALVIGLGIGTAPKAFISHGINTTIVELDPVVHDYATKYFALPQTHTPVLSDAIAWVHTQSTTTTTTPQEKYDYILHDVFTGGAEPLHLFTTIFLKNLRSLLTPNGVAALNYAGDLSMPLTSRILNTIDLAFNRQCKVYRDAPSTPDSDSFSNLVVFCRNSPGAIDFRQPTEKDFLGSQSRRSYLFPRPEFAIQFPLRGTERAGEVLEDGGVAEWRAQQEESSSRHWRIMRTVLSGKVWEMY